MTELQPLNTQNPDADPAEVFEEVMKSGGDEEARTQHDQRIARERHTDQLSSSGADEWGPAGQSKVGGP